MSKNTIHPNQISYAGTDASVLTNIGYASWKAAILEAALRLGVWDRIQAGKRTAKALSQSEHWDLTGIRRLLNALCALRLLTKDGELYYLVPIAELYLLPGEPTYMGDLLMSGIAWEGHGKLADAVRTGKRPLVSAWNDTRFATRWARAHAPEKVMLERSIEEAESMWELLGIQARDRLHVLDIACGYGIKGLALARRHPGTSITLIDWLPVLEVAEEIAQDLAVKNQVTLLPGDVRFVDFGQNKFNVAFLGHIVHYFGPVDVVSLLKKVHISLLPGGSIVLNEVIVDEGRFKREKPLLSAIWLFCVTADGDIYTFSELEGLLKQAGFASIRQVGKIRGESEGCIRALKEA